MRTVGPWIMWTWTLDLRRISTLWTRASAKRSGLFSLALVLFNPGTRRSRALLVNLAQGAVQE